MCEEVGFCLANIILILSGFRDRVTWGQLLLPMPFVPKVWNWKKDLKLKKKTIWKQKNIWKWKKKNT